jgi:predicted RNase H-like nuclease (RuvC/YqgF family)
VEPPRPAREPITSIEQAVSEAKQIVENLKDVLDEMEEIIEMLDQVRDEKTADEVQIEALRREMRNIQSNYGQPQRPRLPQESSPQPIQQSFRHGGRPRGRR